MTKDIICTLKMLIYASELISKDIQYCMIQLRKLSTMQEDQVGRTSDICTGIFQACFVILQIIK